MFKVRISVKFKVRKGKKRALKGKDIWGCEGGLGLGSGLWLWLGLGLGLGLGGG